MVPRKIEKTLSLLIAQFIILTALVYDPDWELVSFRYGSPLLNRFIYPFFHASILHAVLNVWSLLSIVFLSDLLWWHILLAYIIAVAAPQFTVTEIHTVGLSAVCFALLGMLVCRARNPLQYIACLTPYLILGFILPCLNGVLHLYAFLAGSVVSIFNLPLPCRKK